MKKFLSIEFVIGLALIALGVTAMTGWLMHVEALVRGGPDLKVMRFNTALCYFTLGIAFVLPTAAGEKHRGKRAAIGWALIVLVGLVLSQYATGIDLPVDWRQLQSWLDRGSSDPGRISLVAGTGLILSGVALVLMERAPGRINGACIHLAIFGVLLMGLCGLVGYVLRFDIIYPTQDLLRTSVQSTAALILTATALWVIWHRMQGRQASGGLRADERIGLVGGFVLSIVVLTVGVFGLRAQMDGVQRALTGELRLLLESRHALLRTAVLRHLDKAEQGARRPSVISLAAQHASTPGDAAAAAESFLLSGFSGVAILDVNGRELARAGRFLEQVELQADLSMGQQTTLLWGPGGGYYLKSRVGIIDGGRWIGTLVSEQPEPVLHENFFNVKDLGTTGEAGICFDAGRPTFSCFPQSHSDKPYEIVREGTDGQPTGMNMAIAGKEGDLIGQDYRGHIVVSVYRPLAPGMGLGVKRDVEDLFQPIREQVKWGLALVLSIVGAGTLLLRSLVRPIATRLWESEAEAKKRELRARATLDNLAEGVVTLDEHGVIESFGGGAPALFGYAPEEVIGQSVKMLLPPKMRLRYSAHIQDYLRQSIGKRNAELLALRKDGTVFVMEFALNDLWLDGQRFFAVVVRDITERHQAEKALFEEKETLHVTLNSIGDGVITTDTAGCVTYLNPVAEHMTGWSNAEAVGQPFLEVFHIIHEATDEPTLNPVEVVLRSNESAGLAEHTVLVSRSGKRIAIEDSAAPIHDRSGKVIGVVLAFHDVSEARKVAAKMTHQAAHDALTGLVNRREFERRLQRVLDSGQHADNTLLYLDLDRFKIVNDTCGHQAGDELLRKLSELLQTAVRGNDTLARLGGDEFAVLLENCPAEPALRIAERILQIVNNFRFGWQEKAFQIGVSIGMVTFSGDGLTMADILSMVDAACYVAKDTGRNRIQVYTPDDKVLAQRHGETTWLQRIRQALDEDRFVLHAQPIMSLRAGPDDEEHVELLLRMVEDDKLIPPTAFIPAAERYGLMPEIDRWVIRSAFANYVQRGAEDGAPGMYAINLSGASVSDEHFLAFVLEQFQHHAVPPQKICFEITETAAIANLKLATQLIQGLKAIGCRFALDDFGSGMSSFGYLKHLPVDCLKIDGSFVKAMVSDPIDYAMVTSINQIGHVMGMQTIAEFVEDDAILDALRNIGVDFAQGFGIAKPAPLNTVWLKAAA